MPTSSFQPADYWRAIILYGLNTATYKIALGQALTGFVAEGAATVPMGRLAETFLDLYRERLRNGRPQLMLLGRLTVMERVVAPLEGGQLTRGEAIDRGGAGRAQRRAAALPRGGGPRRPHPHADLRVPGLLRHYLLSAAPD